MMKDYRTKLICLLQCTVMAVVMCFCLSASAQVTLKGIAVRMNSGFTPVSGVAVYAAESTPTYTDGAGNFCLRLPNAEPGDLLYNLRIEKKDMEIVNLREVEQWVASGDILYKIVLCPKGFIAENRRKYYAVGKSNYEREYEKQAAALRRELESSNADEAACRVALEALNAEFDKKMKLLAVYSDRFARINKDELSDMEKKALEHVERGEVDEAIRLYEDSKIWETFRAKVGQRDSIAASLEVTRRLLRQQIEWYERIGSDSALQKKRVLEEMLQRY